MVKEGGRVGSPGQIIQPLPLNPQLELRGNEAVVEGHVVSKVPSAQKSGFRVTAGSVLQLDWRLWVELAKA